MIFCFANFQHSAPAVPSSFQAAPFSRQSLGPIGGGLGLSYGAYGQSMTQQGLPGTGGFPMGSTSQPSELSTVAGGGGGGGVGSLDQQPNTTPGAVPAPIGAPPQSGTHALHQTGRNKCHSYASVAKLRGEASCDTTDSFFILQACYC